MWWGAWRGFKRASLALCVAWSVSACKLEPSSQASSSALARRPARLQAITYAPRPDVAGSGLIIATDVAFYEGLWGEGRTLWIDAESGALLGAYYSGQANPQALTLLGDPPYALLTVEGGALELGEEPSSAHAALTLHPLNAPFTEPQRATFISAPLTQGYPINALSLTRREQTGEEEEDELYLSSGISGLVWRLSHLWDHPLSSPLTPLSATPLRYASEGTLSLGSLARWGERALVVDFNSDRLVIIDEGELTPCSPHLGRFEGVMEGAQTPRVAGDTLWLTFGLSGELVSFDLSELDLNNPQCTLTRQALTPALGAVPNHLTLSDESVYVVHSGEQDVWRYSQERGAREARLALPPNTHPWAATLTPQGRLIVTGWLSGALHELERVEPQTETHIGGLTGELAGGARLLTPPEVLSAFPPRRCERPHEWSAEEPLKLSPEGLTLTWSSLTNPAHTNPAHNETSAPASLLQGVPQLALKLSGEGEVRVEVQQSEGGAWQELTTLTLTPRDTLSVHTPSSPQLLSAEALVLTRSENSEHLTSTLNPCDAFKPDPARVRLRLDAISDQPASLLPPYTQSSQVPPPQTLWLLGDAQAGRHPLHALRLTPLTPLTPPSHLTEGMPQIKVMEVVYRAW